MSTDHRSVGIGGRPVRWAFLLLLLAFVLALGMILAAGGQLTRPDFDVLLGSWAAAVTLAWLID